MAVVAQRNGVRMIAYQKCGHTSIINMFRTPAGESVQRGRTFDELCGTTEDAQDWPKPDTIITFFRHPLLRALSTYEHFLVRGIQHPVNSPVISFDGEETKQGKPSLGRQSFTDLGFTADMDFPAFVLHLRNIELCADKHLKPQAISFWEAYDGRASVYAGQLEQLHITWPLIVEQYGLDCTLEIPRYNLAEYEVNDRLSGVRLDMFKDLYLRDYSYWDAAHFETGTPISSVSH
jgi:hypothetical protein